MFNSVDTTFYNLPFKLDYRYINTVEDAFKTFEYFDKFNAVGVDIEATGLDPFEDKVLLLQLALPNGKVFVYDIRYIPFELFKTILEDTRFLHILQNSIYDYKMIKQGYNIEISRIYDTMLAERCLTLGLNSSANLESLVYKYLNYNIEKDVAKDFVGGITGELTNRQIQYAAHDAACLFGIVKAQAPAIESNKLNRVCKLEFEFAPCMANMELVGVLLDKENWRTMMAETKRDLDAVVNAILPALEPGIRQRGLFGTPAINLSSTSQLLTCLKNMGLQLKDTSVSSLHKVKLAHPVIPLLLKYRQLEKLLNSFGENILKKINPKTGRLHPSYTQMVRTGRLSCSNPNLQQMPGQKSFRSCFIAKPGYKMVTSDMSQAELRILACLSKDPVFIETYKKGGDIHVATACDVFGLTEEEIIADKNLPDDDPAKKDYRKHTKALNFGLCICSNSIIFTNKGMKEIKNSNINDVVAHDIGKDKIIDKQYRGKKEVFEIKTKYGYTLEVTEDHPIKVINSDGNYVDKTLKDVDIDVDQACLKAGSNLFANEMYRFDKFSVKKNSNYKHLDLPKVLDENWAAFLGLFVAEGSMPVRKGKNYSWSVEFKFSKNESEILDSVYNLLYLLFGDRLSVSNKGRCAEYKISSSLLAAWVKSLFNLESNKTLTIHIPDCIKKSPKNIQTSFIRWAFEGDGSIASNQNGVRIRYASTSYVLVKDLQLLLLNMNIISSITYHYDKRYPGKKFYDLSIVSDNSRQLFMKQIGFVTNYKNNRCFSSINCTMPFYNINNQSNRLKNIKPCKTIKYLLSKDIRLNHINNTHLKNFSKYDDFFKFIYDNNIITLPIVSIKSKGVKPVYDISVENRELFLANGFVVHNCYGMSKYGLAERLGISEDEAEKFINDYFRAYPRVKSYLDGAAEKAINKGYSVTISGRRRYYNFPGSEVNDDERKNILNHIRRCGKNTGVQGCLGANTNVFGAGLIKNNVGKQRILFCDKGKTIRAFGKYSGKQKVYKIVTNMGFTLTGTFEHPISVKNGKYSGNNMCALGESLGKSVKMYANKYEGFPISIENIIKRFKVETRNYYITKELAFILGCLYDSGYFESRQKLFYIKNRVLIEKLNSCCIKYFVKSGNIRKRCPIKFINKGSKIFISFSENVKKLLYNMLYNKKNKIRHMSDILNSPVEIREAFVSGFLGCRARSSNDKEGLFILCSNDIIAFTIQQLLLSLGIISFKEVGNNGEAQLSVINDFITNVGSFINEYGFGLNMYTRMPESEFYDVVKSVKYVGIEDTYDFVSPDEPHRYVANGFKVSNSNADVLKQSIINLNKNIKTGSYDASVVLNIHDEIVVETKENQTKEVSQILSKSIIDAWDSFFTEVPMVADSTVDFCWSK